MNATKSFKIVIGATVQISHTGVASEIKIKTSDDLVKHLTNNELVELFINASSDAGVEVSRKLNRFATKKIGAQKS